MFTRVILYTTLILALFLPISCDKQLTPEQKQQQKELTKNMDAIQLQIGKMLTNPEGVEESDVKDAMAKYSALKDSYDELSGSGASWVDISKGVLGGVLGRSLLHGVRAIIMAYLPGPLGAGVAGFLGLILGKSGTGSKKEE